MSNYESNNNSDKSQIEREVNTYESCLKKELIKETFVNNDTDIERSIFLVKELNKIDPPVDIDVKKSLEDFHHKYMADYQRYGKCTFKKATIALIAAVTVLFSSCIAVIGYKLNIFDMIIDFNNYDKRIQYHMSLDNQSETEELEGLKESSSMIEVDQITEAIKYIPFKPLVPHYLPNGYDIDNIKIDKPTENFVNLYMIYKNERSDDTIYWHITYSAQTKNEEITKSYEKDYQQIDSVIIWGQDCAIISDNYNINCSFTYDQAVYSLTTSKNLPMSELRKILDSINYEGG